MTREEALKIWLPVIKMGVESMQECNEALDMAIKALEQEPCTNAISRQAAIDGADAIIARDTSGNNDVVKAMTAWKSYIEGLPLVIPAEKPNKWEDEDSEQNEDEFGFIDPFSFRKDTENDD